MSSQQGPWKREDLITNKIPVEKIPGLVRSESMTAEEMFGRANANVRPSLNPNELYAFEAPLFDYVRCPVDRAYQYFSNIFSLEEWTATLRSLTHVRDDLYVGQEMLVPNTKIWVRVKAYPDARVVDQHCAWDQGDELWMRYHFRFLDALPTVGKPGTLISWTNYKHAYYDRKTPNLPKAIKEGQDRTDRPMWVGDLWPLFIPAHRLELDNLIRILETRFGSELKG